MHAELANLGVPASQARSCRCRCSNWPGKLLVSAAGVRDHLASDLAANITGEALNVSGGQQMH